jgi:methyl-accepting chemotaxis protein
MNFHKRRNYFVEKIFQTKYMLMTVALLLVYSFIFIAIIFTPYVLTLNFDTTLMERTDAAKAILLLHGRIWPWVGGVVIFFAIVSIFISHNVAGPLFRMKRSIAQVADGDLSIVIRLRKWDDLHDFAEQINKLLDELRAFVTTLKTDHDFLSGYISDLEQKMAAKTLSEETGREIISKIQDRRKNIEAALEKFNIQR